MERCEPEDDAPSSDTREPEDDADAPIHMTFAAMRDGAIVPLTEDDCHDIAQWLGTRAIPRAEDAEGS